MDHRQSVPPAIELRSVTKTYRRRGRAAITPVDDLSLTVPAGQIFGFLGPNGAGKTTTIKMICGLITPSSGQIRVGGQDVARQRHAVMRQIGAVLEGGRNIYWRLSAWQNLMYFGRLKGCASDQLRDRARVLLQELDLWERRDAPVGDFSRGMQQKVAIAAALIHDPTIVLLDEPTIGLDVHSARIVKAWIPQLAQQYGKTVVLTSHELDMVQEVCERVAIMYEGRLVADRLVSDLLHLFREDYYELRIARPLSPAALDSLPGLTQTVGQEDVTLSGQIADQDTLYRYLACLQELHVPLLSVNVREPSLEEIFMRLTDRVRAEP